MCRHKKAGKQACKHNKHCTAISGQAPIVYPSVLPGWLPLAEVTDRQTDTHTHTHTDTHTHTHEQHQQVGACKLDDTFVYPAFTQQLSELSGSESPSCRPLRHGGRGVLLRKRRGAGINVCKPFEITIHHLARYDVPAGDHQANWSWPLGCMRGIDSRCTGAVASAG